jgi:Domain of unknown function (DUF4214)
MPTAPRRRISAPIVSARPRRARRPVLDLLECRRLLTTYVVNSLEDLLAPPSGLVTLRSAIQAADLSPAGSSNTIDLSLAGTYAIASASAATDNTAGEFAITGPYDSNLTIVNTSGGRAVISGAGHSRVFDIDPSGQDIGPTYVDFEDVTITGGNSGGDGGGIRIQGSTLAGFDEDDITDNTAGGSGGGVASSDRVVFQNSTIVGNRAASGGGVFGDGVTVAVGCFIQGNVATASGGGFDLEGLSPDFSTLADDQIVANQAADGGAIATSTSLDLGQDTLELDLATSTTPVGYLGDGGALFVNLDAQSIPGVEVTDCLFLGDSASNSGAGAGGAIAQFSGILAIQNTQLSGNSADGIAGGILFAGSTLTVLNTTIDHSFAGALEFAGSGAGSALTDDTIADNATGGIGDAGPGALMLQSDTINANQGFGIAGGGPGGLTIEDTIIAQDGSGSTPDIAGGRIVDDGGNLIGDDTGGPAFARSTLIGTASRPINPGLGPLLDNGSTTPFEQVPTVHYLDYPGAGTTGTYRVVPTEALATSSPAFGAGIVNLTLADERGFPPPSSKPSIGAYQPQYARTATPAQVYVEDLYEILLDRTASASEVASWVPYVTPGSNAALVQTFTSSTEYRTDQISLFYEEDLGRAVDPGGLQHWLGVLAAGGTLAEVQAAIIGSPEFFGPHGSNADTFTEAVYEGVLNRLPSTGEVDSWYGSLASGTTPNAEALDFILSAEDETNLVQADYSALLGRSASSAEVAAWLEALAGSVDPQTTLVDVILGSPEAYADHA